MAQIVPQNLFTQAAGSKSSSQKRYLVELKAGKMFRDSNNLVTADPRKGLVYLKKSEDQLIHFCWMDRKNNQTEDDLIIFPEDAEWLKVAECTTGRAYVLKFKSSSQRLFFWLQEPSADKDEELAKNINDYLNNPAAAMVAVDEDEEMADADDVEQQNQLLRLLASQGIIPESMANGIRPPAQSNALTADVLRPIVSDATLRQRLFPSVSASQELTEAALNTLIQSSTFKQDLSALGTALEAGQLAPLITELGLDPSVATGEGDRVIALLRAISEKKRGSSA